jgi:hypothetical protein
VGGREEGRVRGCEEGVCVHVFLRALRALRARPSSSAACTSFRARPSSAACTSCRARPSRALRARPEQDVHAELEKERIAGVAAASR